MWPKSSLHPRHPTQKKSCVYKNLSHFGDLCVFLCCLHLFFAVFFRLLSKLRKYLFFFAFRLDEVFIERLLTHRHRTRTPRRGDERKAESLWEKLTNFQAAPQSSAAWSFRPFCPLTICSTFCSLFIIFQLPTLHQRRREKNQIESGGNNIVDSFFFPSLFLGGRCRVEIAASLFIILIRFASASTQ